MADEVKTEAQVEGLNASEVPAAEPRDQDAAERQALADADGRKEYSGAELGNQGEDDARPYDDVRSREADRPQNLEEELHRLAERAKAIVGYREHPQHEEVPVVGQEHQQEAAAERDDDEPVAEDARDEGGVERS